MGSRHGSELCPLATGDAQCDRLDRTPNTFRSGTFAITVVHQVQIQVSRVS
jgi:hypothetical protein